MRIIANDEDKKVDIDKLIKNFTDIAKRGNLLTNSHLQNDLLIQIIGIIVKTKLEEGEE